jgi:hypothetical protein
MNEIYETKSGKGQGDKKKNNKLGLKERSESKGRYMDDKKGVY